MGWPKAVEVRGVTNAVECRVAEEICTGIEQFLRAGVDAIEAACNQRREEVLAEPRSRPPDELLAKWGLPDITVRTALAEATPPFVLTDPGQFVLEIRPVGLRSDPNCPQAACTPGRDAPAF